MIRNWLFNIRDSRTSHVHAVRLMKQINYLKVKGNNNSMCNKVNKYEKGGSYEK